MNKIALVTGASSGIKSGEKIMSNLSSKGTALITGASRGIGAVYADRLAKRGYDLILVARSQAPLQALAATLSRSTGRRTTPIVADVNNKQDLARVEAKLKDDPSITMLVNNAGFASVAPLLDADIEKMEEMIALNISALTRLTYAAAPAFVKRGAGTIINIGSAAGISVEAMNGVYAASKAYVLAFSLSLQHELTSKGIRVQVVLPGRTATDGWDVAGFPWQKMPPEIVMPVEDMVDAALVGLDQGELVTIPGLHNGDEWTRFEAICRGMLPQFGTSVPAPRYRNQARILEDRLRAIEDRLAIYTLIASHPPSADTAAANYTREVYVEDGVFDRGPKLEGAYGVDAIASFTLKPEHKEAIQGGLAHFAGLPLIDLRGDQAIVTSYLQILCLDHQGEPRELPNHGVSQGYRIHRVYANRWQLVKTKGEWMIKTRTILPIDGSSEPLEILSQGLNDVLKSRQKEAAHA